MAKSTPQEILDDVASLYAVKQDLAALDDALNTQAASIMDTARVQVQALKDGQTMARQAAMDTMQQIETRLNKGT